MYDELVKRLRDAAKMSEALAVLLPHSEGNATAKLHKEAADAIEQLSNAGSAYGRGWTLGYDAGRDENMPRWIPVTERLPEKNQIVVVVQRGKTWDYGQFRGLDYLGNDVRKWTWKNNTTKTVDYWMPKKSALPEPPKEE